MLNPLNCGGTLITVIPPPSRATGGAPVGPAPSLALDTRRTASARKPRIRRRRLPALADTFRFSRARAPVRFIDLPRSVPALPTPLGPCPATAVVTLLRGLLGRRGARLLPTAPMPPLAEAH